MSHFTFHEKVPVGPDNYRDREEFEPTLFHLPEHLRLQSPKGWRSFFVLNEKTKSISALVHFLIKDNVAYSPYKASFGSFLFADNLPSRELVNFIQFTQSKLKKQRVQCISLTNPAVGYDPARQSILQTLLLNTGFSVKRTELSALVAIEREPFESLIDTWERRKLKQSRAAGLTVSVISLDRLSMVYRFIHNCRKEKGYELSMNEKEVAQLARTFPDRLVLTAVNDKNRMAAASISIRVTTDVLYNFYSDHHADYNRLSPVVMLIGELYKMSQTDGVRILDLGTSALNNKPNFSLLDFKLRLGALPSTKFTFIKNL